MPFSRFKLGAGGETQRARAEGIRVFYTGAQALDRYEHRPIIAF